MKSENIELETKVIERFVIEPKRERYISFLKDAKTRKKFTNQLAHFNDLREELFERIKGGDEIKVIKDKVKILGNLKDCYLLSESPELDQKRMNIDAALSEIIGFGMGTLVVFGDAEMVYYEGESPNDRWISTIPFTK